MTFDENPGVYDDEYEAEWASVIDDARADPAGGLGDLLSIVDRILSDHGLAGARRAARLRARDRGPPR
jgi:hypothetical protein